MDIISKLHQLIHQTGNLIELEESVRLYMYDVFATYMGEVFMAMNNTIVEEKHNLDDFTLWLDSYESTLEDDKKLEKVKEFRTYINRNWKRIIDWRECVEVPPQDARSLGAMESNQRRVTYRMKKRGMHWSQEGAEAMVKVKQGMFNGTLRDVYLKDQRRTSRKQRELKRTVKKAQNLHQPTRPSIGARQGGIGLYTAHSSLLGKLRKRLQP